MPIPTARILTNDDHCRRLAHYDVRWEPPARTPKEILLLAIEFGLLSDSDDPGEAAADYAMELAVEKTIDTAETDILGLASHGSSMADFITWLLRAENQPWERPQPIELPDGHIWDSGAFLSQRGLKHLALVDRLDAMTEMSLRNSWAVRGESSVYEMPVDIICVEIGTLRAGRWSNPFTKGYRHPQANTLRFRKRDGEVFGANWERVERETDEATREEWLDAMTDDGILEERVHLLQCDIPEDQPEVVDLAQTKLARQSSVIPEKQPSRCFEKLRPCPYRGCCPQGVDPSMDNGFSPRA